MTTPPPEYEAIDYHINTARRSLDERFRIDHDLQAASAHGIVACALALRVIAAAHDGALQRYEDVSHEPT